MAKTANELLYDATIRHQIKLLRFSEGQANAVSKLLKAADDELVAKLQSDLTEASEARLKALLADVRKQREALAERVGNKIKEDMTELAGNEAEWEMEAIAASCPVELTMTAVSTATLKSLASRPINGVPLEGWLGSMAAGDINRIEQQIRQGVTQGETLDQLVRRIRGTKANNYEDGVTSITRRNAQTIARTTVNHVSNSARQATWDANADIISGVRWVATLDGRTSDVCRGRDGVVYPINEGPRPPGHPGCRSTTTPVLAGDRILGERPFVRDTRTRNAREVDFRADAKAAAGDKWKSMTKDERTAAIRAKRDAWGEANIGRVPSSQTYDSWLRGQSKEFQDEVLGPSKGKMFRDGMTMDKFIDEKGKPYTIAELKAATSQDKLNVVQPGVGMKAKALLQQGLSNAEILDQIKKEYPDANTTAASLASYKTELKKAGALDQLVGQLPSGGVKQALAVSDVVSNMEANLPPGLKHAIGGQWATVVEDLDGVPGAYGYYQAGKGVQLSGKKLSAVSQQQAQQVIAHELGHLLHKQHDVAFNDFESDLMKVLPNQLDAADKKVYGYYLAHQDELTAEIFAQALSPSPLTSQGLSAIKFNQTFAPMIDLAKTKMLEKFPVPHKDAPAPLMGGPSVPFEVAGKHTTVGGLAKALLQQGMPDDQVLKAVLAEFPTAKTSKASLASYKVELKKQGLMPAKASGPTVVTKSVPGVTPVGLKASSSGVKSSLDVVKETLATQGTSTPIVTLSNILKAAGFNSLSYDDVYDLKALAQAAPSVPKGLKEPALTGKQLGSISTQALAKLESYLANGGGMPGAHELLKGIFSGYQPAMGEALIELAQYKLATGKMMAKPYLAAGYAVDPLAAAAAAKAQASAKAALDALNAINMTPARPVATPREGIPPPPRFTSQQRRAALQRLAGRVESGVVTNINAKQKALGLEEVTVEEGAAIRSYTGSLYQELNSSLRRGEYSSDHSLQAYVEAAQHGLSKMPKYKGLTSRGITLSQSGIERMLAAYQPGAVIEEAAFISTSTGEKAAFGGNVFLRIMSRTGVDVSPFSKFPGEREVLYMPGTRLRVTKVTKTPSGTHVIEMEEI